MISLGSSERPVQRLGSDLSLVRGARDALSRSILLPLGRSVRATLPATRAEAEAFTTGIEFRHASTHWSDDQKRDWILGRLRESVRAAVRIPFHARRFEQVGLDPAASFDFDDFAKLPVLEPALVRDLGESLTDPGVPPGRRETQSTGGSTGVPTRVWTGPIERGWSSSGTEFFMRSIGLPEGTRAGLLWGHHLDPVNSDHWRDRMHAFVCNYRWFDCFRLSPEVLEGYHEDLQRFRPDVVVAYATALGYLAEHILAKGHKPDYPRLAFITGAEKLTLESRRAIEKAFGKPVHERYGSRDAGLMSFQLDPARSLRTTVDWANILVEPESGAEQASILITKLHADAMPLLRYRVGDLGRFPAGSVPGHPSLHLEEVVGRITDRIWLADGRWMDGHQVPHLLKDFAIREYALVQNADTTIELFIETRAGFDVAQHNAIERIMTAGIAPLPFQIHVVDRVPRGPAGKLRPVRSYVGT